MVILPTAQRTTAQTGDSQRNTGPNPYKGVRVRVVSTAVSDTPEVTVTIQGYDEAAAAWYTILASVAITGTATTVYRVHPSLTAVANSIAQDTIPALWRIITTVGNADPLSYSINADPMY